MNSPGPPGAGALLAGKPDFFLGDGGEVGKAGELAGSGGQNGEGGGVIHLLTRTMFRARDKLDYHVLVACYAFRDEQRETLLLYATV